MAGEAKRSGTPGEMKLKPCPFCRKVPTLQTADDGTAARVFCQNIFCKMSTVMTPICAHADEAIDIWDTRAESDLLGKCLEAIEGAMRIKDLWTFPPGIPLVGNAEQEAIATSIMEERFKAILAKAKGE